jgi:hypothetical protein
VIESNPDVIGTHKKFLTSSRQKKCCYFLRPPRLEAKGAELTTEVEVEVEVEVEAELTWDEVNWDEVKAESTWDEHEFKSALWSEIWSFGDKIELMIDSWSLCLSCRVPPLSAWMQGVTNRHTLES